MQFYLYQVRNPKLQPHIEYVLFNFHTSATPSEVVTSYANTNICLGIIKGQELVELEDGLKTTVDKGTITSYLSGLYLKPHQFQTAGPMDEICINFSPLGYYHFFKIPLQTYIFQEDILSEAFGEIAKPFFEEVFNEPDFQKRGLQIERFFLSKMQGFHAPFLQDCLCLMEKRALDLSLNELQTELKCSEKKLYRTFKKYLDQSPKAYLRMAKFRKVLNALHNAPPKMLTKICYNAGYYDQSHFIKDFRHFTGTSPKKIQRELQKVGDAVILTVA